MDFIQKMWNLANPVNFIGQTVSDPDFVDLVDEHTVPKFLRFGISAALAGPLGALMRYAGEGMGDKTRPR